METIFGNGLATGKYAMGSNEALGSPSLFYDSDVKSEPYDEEKAAKGMDEHAKKFANVPKEIDTEAREKKKRKRSFLSEEEHAVFSSMTEAVKDVVAAICETKVEVLNPDLYGAVMYMGGLLRRL
jgi:DNA-directed RNA polymerase alpha subunit